MLFFNFKAIPDTLEGALNNGKETYNPPVSDVSDCEIVAPTELMKKASKSGHENTFGIFTAIMARKAACDVIQQKHPGIAALNPPRTDQEMWDLGTKRWVCVSSTFVTLQRICEKIRKIGMKIRYCNRVAMNRLQFLQCGITSNLSYFAASKSLPKQK